MVLRAIGYVATREMRKNLLIMKVRPSKRNVDFDFKYARRWLYDQKQRCAKIEKLALWNWAGIRIQFFLLVTAAGSVFRSKALGSGLDSDPKIDDSVDLS